jgi:hypothetical protein
MCPGITTRLTGAHLVPGVRMDGTHERTSSQPRPSHHQHIRHLTRLSRDAETRGGCRAALRDRGLGAWVLAWKQAARATVHVFPHRARELETHESYVLYLFNGCLVPMHDRVIHLTKKYGWTSLPSAMPCLRMSSLSDTGKELTSATKGRPHPLRGISLDQMPELPIGFSRFAITTMDSATLRPSAASQPTL